MRMRDPVLGADRVRQQGCGASGRWGLAGRLGNRKFFRDAVSERFGFSHAQW